MNYPLLSEYVESIRSAEDNLAELNHLHPVLDANGDPVMTGGNFAVVFKMQDKNTGKLYALKCFTKEQEGRAEAYRLIAEELESVNSSYLTPIKYLGKELFVDSNATDETEFPVLLMDWVEGKTLDKYIRENLDDQYALEMLAYQFSRLAMWLLPQPFAHGDLKPDNIIVSEDGSLVLVDYDGMYVPAMKGQKARELGSPDFRHPSRTTDEFNERIDDFPIASILLSLKAIALQPGLLEEYGAKDRLLLSEADYRNISGSQLFKQVFPSDNMELNKLMNLFMLVLSENNLSGISSNLFNLQKPKNVVYSTEVTEEDLSNAWVDEFGVKYSADRKRLLEAPNDLTNYIIRKGTVVICDDSFYCCYNLVSIVIPNSVKIIGDFAFGHCSSLASVNLPDTVTNINEYAFSDCDSLNSVFLPPLISILREGVFCGCSGLISIVIPETVKIIENNTFSGCKGLSSIVIPSSVSSIGNYSFQGCSGLASIIVEKGNSFYDSRNYCNAIIETKSNMLIAGCLSTIIPNDVSVISDGAFNGCSGLTSIMIPRSVTNIGNRSFYGCSGLTSITIPDSVNSIGNRAFEACGSLKSITLFDGVESLGFSSFSCCTSLTSIFIPSSVTYIGRMAFLYCEALSSVTFTNSEIIIEEGVFWNCKNLKSIFIQQGTREKFERLLPEYKDKLVEQDDSDVYSTEVTEEDLANAWVDEYGFKYSADKKRLLQAWPDNYLYNTFSIRKETIIICDHAFSGFPLEYGDRIRIILPEGLRAIGDFAFSMGNLNYIEIPSSVVLIGKGALKGCLEVVCYSNHYKMVDDCLFTSDMKRVLFCSPKLESIVFPSTVTIIEPDAFSRIYVELTSNNYLRSITLPNSLNSILENDLADCEHLTSIYIPNGTKDRFEKLLPNYKNILVELKEDKSLSTHVSKENLANAWVDEYGALYSNDKRKLLKGPKDYFLLREYSLNSKYTIRDGTEVICDYVLAGSLHGFDNGWMSGEDVNSIDEIFIPNSVTHIGRFAFSYCGYNTVITIPRSVVSINIGAFAGCTFKINCLSDSFICLNGFFIRKSNSALIYYYRSHCDSVDNNDIVIIPPLVKVIEDYAFYFRTGISKISIPDTVSSVGKNAFERCDSLEEILIPPKSLMIFEQMLPDYRHLLKEI